MLLLDVFQQYLETPANGPLKAPRMKEYCGASYLLESQPPLHFTLKVTPVRNTQILVLTKLELII